MGHISVRLEHVSSQFTSCFRPTDLENLEIMNKWVDCCSVIRSEIFGDDEKAFKKRIGNVLPAMTIPVFAGIYLRIFDK